MTKNVAGAYQVRLSIEDKVAYSSSGPSDLSCCSGEAGIGRQSSASEAGVLAELEIVRPMQHIWIGPERS